MVSTFGVIVILAVSVQVLILVVLHALPTGYHPVRDAISDYGVGRYRGYFWAQLAAGALACAFVAFALADLHPYAPTVVVVLLLANAAARLLYASVPNRPVRQSLQIGQGHCPYVPRHCGIRGRGGRCHRFGGSVPSLPPGYALKRASRRSRLGGPCWRSRDCAGAPTGGRLKRVFGLVERLFTLSVIVWLYVISIELVRLAK